MRTAMNGKHAWNLVGARGKTSPTSRGGRVNSSENAHNGHTNLSSPSSANAGVYIPSCPSSDRVGPPASRAPAAAACDSPDADRTSPDSVGFDAG